MNGWRLLSIVLLFSAPVMVIRVWLWTFGAVSDRDFDGSTWIGLTAATVASVLLGYAYFRLGAWAFSDGPA